MADPSPEGAKDPKSIDWDQRYRSGNTPWDRGEPDSHLVRFLGELEISSGRALDLGCGTGTNAIWLAQQGLEVTGLDLSPLAIEKAKGRAERASVAVDFQVTDALTEELPPGPFDLVTDRGFFHIFAQPEDRAQLAKKVADRLRDGGIWLSVLGSTEGPPRKAGPPRRSAGEITAAVEPFLEVLELRGVDLDPIDHPGVRAWVLQARRRGSFPTR